MFARNAFKRMQGSYNSTARTMLDFAVAIVAIGVADRVYAWFKRSDAERKIIRWNRNQEFIGPVEMTPLHERLLGRTYLSPDQTTSSVRIGSSGMILRSQFGKVVEEKQLYRDGITKRYTRRAFDGSPDDIYVDEESHLCALCRSAWVMDALGACCNRCADSLSPPSQRDHPKQSDESN